MIHIKLGSLEVTFLHFENPHPKNWGNLCGKQCGGPSKKLKIRYYDPGIMLLDIYPQKMKIIIQRATCILMCIYSSIIYNSQSVEAAQVSIDRWLDKEDVVYIHNGILFSHKRQWNLAICDNMDETIDYNPKWNKSDKDKYHMISLICGI